MNAEKAVIGYFHHKHIENLGYLKYGYFRRIIGYIIDQYHEYFIRKIFLSLVNKGFFIKVKNKKKSYKYKFNPNAEIKDETLIDPNRFIISWD